VNPSFASAGFRPLPLVASLAILAVSYTPFGRLVLLFFERAAFPPPSTPIPAHYLLFSAFCVRNGHSYERPLRLPSHIASFFDKLEIPVLLEISSIPTAVFILCMSHFRAPLTRPFSRSDVSILGNSRVGVFPLTPRLAKVFFPLHVFLTSRAFFPSFPLIHHFQDHHSRGQSASSLRLFPFLSVLDISPSLPDPSWIHAPRSLFPLLSHVLIDGPNPLTLCLELLFFLLVSRSPFLATLTLVGSRAERADYFAAFLRAFSLPPLKVLASTSSSRRFPVYELARG